MCDVQIVRYITVQNPDDSLHTGENPRCRFTLLRCCADLNAMCRCLLAEFVLQVVNQEHVNQQYLIYRRYSDFEEMVSEAHRRIFCLSVLTHRFPSTCSITPFGTR